MLSIAYAMGEMPQAQGGAQQTWGPMLMMGLIFVIFYFLLIKPQQKKQQEHLQMVKGLKKNDEVMTSGGIHGTIVNVKDNSVTLRVDDNCRLEIQKNAISVIKKTRE